MTIRNFLTFLKNAPTPWHTTFELSEGLKDNGFSQLEETSSWDFGKGKKFFVKRGGALIAFHLPKKKPVRATIAASHTDSPCLKIKPHPQFRSHNMNLFRIDSYGGPLLSTWFDRDLAIAGQIYSLKQGSLCSDLVYCKKTQVTIPSLAIHLQEKKEGTPKQYLDKQEHLCPLLGLSEKEEDSLEKILKAHLKVKEILASDLYLVPTQDPSILGTSSDLIAGYRIDNLSSVYACYDALILANQQDETLCMSVFWNHEEIGSDTLEGAGSPFLEEVLRRICLYFDTNEETYFRMKANSICISLDVAHAFHPNFSKRYDSEDHPLFGKGMIIKHSSNLRYATTAKLCASVKALCKKRKIPFQESALHSEVKGGTTVGPIAATVLGIETIDIGAPLLAMHSTRELLCEKDQESLHQFLKVAFEELKL